MIVKYYIYRNKCLNLIPTGISAIVNIYNYIAKEHAAALYSDKIRKYELKWNKFIKMCLNGIRMIVASSQFVCLKVYMKLYI